MFDDERRDDPVDIPLDLIRGGRRQHALRPARLDIVRDDGGEALNQSGARQIKRRELLGRGPLCDATFAAETQIGGSQGGHTIQ